MDQEKLANTLKIIGIVVLALGALTLLPSPGASKANLIGYKSKCSFTPVSTVLMFAIAAVLFIIRSRVLRTIAG